MLKQLPPILSPVAHHVCPCRLFAPDPIPTPRVGTQHLKGQLYCTQTLIDPYPGPQFWKHQWHIRPVHKLHQLQPDVYIRQGLMMLSIADAPRPPTHGLTAKTIGACQVARTRACTTKKSSVVCCYWAYLLGTPTANSILSTPHVVGYTRPHPPASLHWWIFASRPKDKQFALRNFPYAISKFPAFKMPSFHRSR